MEITATIGKKNYRVDVAHPHDISIAVRFDGKGVLAFSAPPATSSPFADNDFIGDVQQGGSCNCDMLTFSPHLHGTHTECVGHITHAALYVHDILKDGFIPATLITITPEAARKTKDSYDPACHADDQLITADALEVQLLEANKDFLEALVIRTLPNDDKRSKNYNDARPPYFSIEAMQFLVSMGVKHLVVDMPSIDRLEDEGKLTNHHIFWGLPQGSHAVDAKNPSPKTVTELAYIRDDIADGHYMLNLQVASMATDAAPSRPLLYKVIAA